MSQMLKVKARWSGFQGSPGWTNFYFRDAAEGFFSQTQANDAVAKVNTFFVAAKPLLTSAVTITIQTDVEVVDDADGTLDSVFNVTAPAAIVGTNAVATFSGPTGAVITWRTSSVHNSRRVRGRTFLVPTSTACFQNDGTLDNTHRTNLTTAATALADQAGSPDLVIWARPKKDPVTKAITSPGASFNVTGVTVPDLAAVLRSRRD